MTTDARYITYEQARDVFATKADLADLRVELHQMENRIIKWMVGLMLGSVAIAVSVAVLIQRLTET